MGRRPELKSDEFFVSTPIVIEILSCEKKFTAVIGLDNVVVINTEDATLIVDKNKVEKVKDLVQYLKESDKTDLI